MCSLHLIKKCSDSSSMDSKIVEPMVYGNVNYHSEDSFEVHTIKQNSTNVPECCGFQINIGNNNTLCSAEKYSLLKEEDIMCLQSWVIIKKKSYLGFSSLYQIKGKLCDQKSSNISGKIHNAGFIKKVIKKDLIETTNGKYFLSTPPTDSNNQITKKFYTFWMIAKGFPRKFDEL